MRYTFIHSYTNARMKVLKKKKINKIQNVANKLSPYTNKIIMFLVGYKEVPHQFSIITDSCMRSVLNTFYKISRGCAYGDHPCN